MQPSRSLSSIYSDAAAEKKKRKPFACFRPVVTQGEFKHGRRLDGASQPVFTRLPEGKKDRQTFPKVLPAAFLPVKDDVGVLRPRKKCGCFGFSRILKLILSNKTRKSRQKSNPKSKNQDSNAKNQQICCRDEDPKIISHTSSFSSSRASTAFTSTSLCSSCSSSLAPNSRPSKKSDQQIEERPRSRNWWWLLLICLSCLILWGKVCALCCSMVWLFFVLHQRIRSAPMEKKNMAIDSQEYRKKVIMEGLLDRDRSSSLILPTKKKSFLF